jgi:ferredoxin
VKIVIDRQKCIGAANCVGIAPKTFQLDKEKKVALLDAGAHDDGTLFEAAESCPTEAIRILDDSGEQLFP